jgi:hypothetical protein
VKFKFELEIKKKFLVTYLLEDVLKDSTDEEAKEYQMLIRKV